MSGCVNIVPPSSGLFLIVFTVSFMYPIGFVNDLVLTTSFRFLNLKEWRRKDGADSGFSYSIALQ